MHHQPLPLTAPSLDRDAELRTATDAWSQVELMPNRRVLVASKGVVEAGTHLRWLAPEDAPHGIPIYLGKAQSIAGLEPGTAIELRVIIEPREHVPVLGLRDIISTLAPDELEVAVTAIALANWHATNKHCPTCGDRLTPAHAGWMLACDTCGAQVFPRTDPAVIVLVTDDDGRVLLGSNAMWEANRYSLLAGFVEPGESLEAAVIREVAEEAGVAVTEPCYVLSQPWPFPASLMLGFTAKAASTSVRPDGEEILDVRWFDHDSIQSDQILLPRRGSVARALLERWHGGPILDSHG